MDFEKKFLPPTKSNEYILLKWTKGYREVEVWYHDELIKTIQGAKQLLKEVVFQDDKLGNVKLKLSQNPFFLNIIVNKIHSKTNLQHPSKTIKGVGNWFVLPAIICSLSFVAYLVDELFRVKNYNIKINVIGLSIVAINALIFILPIIFCALKKYIFYLISYFYTILLGIFFLYILSYDINMDSIIGVLVLILLYVGYLTGMTFGLIRVINFIKHKRIQENQHDEILDN